MGKLIGNAELNDITGETRKMNLILSGLMSLFTLSFMLIYHEDLILIIKASLLGGVYMFLTSTCLYELFAYTLRNLGNKRKYYLELRFIAGYCCGLIALILMYFTAGYPLELFSSKLLWTFSIENLVFTILIMLLHNLVIVNSEKNRALIENAELKTKSAEAENLLLKQQIHPHFLFNSLQTLKVLYKRDLVLGEQYLMHLASFLRAAISNNHIISATLEQEMELCLTYLEMQKMRFGNALTWDFNINEIVALQAYLPAFSLQPLLENAIKHNILTIDDPLHICIMQSGQCISVSNNIKRKTYSESSTQIGLNNLAERYYLWSGKELEIKDDGIVFTVSLLFKTHENNYN